MEKKMSDIRKKTYYVNFNKKAYPDSLEMIEREQDLSINRQKEKNPDKSIVCRILLKYKDGRKVRSLLNTLKDWEKCGEGFSPSS